MTPWQSNLTFLLVSFFSDFSTSLSHLPNLQLASHHILLKWPVFPIISGTGYRNRSPCYFTSSSHRIQLSNQTHKEIGYRCCIKCGTYSSTKGRKPFRFRLSQLPWRAKFNPARSLLSEYLQYYVCTQEIHVQSISGKDHPFEGSIKSTQEYSQAFPAAFLTHYSR